MKSKNLYLLGSALTFAFAVVLLVRHKTPAHPGAANQQAQKQIAPKNRPIVLEPMRDQSGQIVEPAKDNKIAEKLKFILKMPQKTKTSQIFTKSRRNFLGVAKEPKLQVALLRLVWFSTIRPSTTI